MVSLQPLWKQSDIFWPERPYMIWILFAFSFEFIISHLPLLVDYALAILTFFLFLKSLWDIVKERVPMCHLSLYAYPSVALPQWLTCPCDLFWPLRQEQIWYKRRLDKHYTLGTFPFLDACGRSLNYPAVSWVTHSSAAFIISANLHSTSRHAVSPAHEWVQRSWDKVL